MLVKVISGGQTGVDQAGWRAAKACGIPTGGYIPKGFLTEEGFRPEFVERYGAVETETTGYQDRTRYNVLEADGTVWFGSQDSPGFKLTRSAGGSRSACDDRSGSETVPCGQDRHHKAVRCRRVDRNEPDRHAQRRG
jgi:hypothetical protein